MKNVKQVVVIGASPKAPGKSTSDFLAEHTAQTLREAGLEARVLNVRAAITRRQTDKAFAAMAAADAMIFLFPLYVFCLPGILMRFLQDYKAYADARPGVGGGAAVYAVVNCGFPEPEINEQAVDVIGRFAAAVGARFRFGIMIGSGGMITLNVPFSKAVLRRYTQTVAAIGAEVVSGQFAQAKPVYLRNSFPAKLYFRIAEMGWRKMVRGNGKQPEDLYARPYQT